MSKTFKISGIILVSVMGLQISRILVSFINLGDNITGWLFSFIMQCLFLGLFPYLMYRGLISKEKGAFVKDVKLNAKLQPKVYLLAVAIGICVYLLNLGVSTIWYVLLTLTGYGYVLGGGVLFTSPEVLIFEIITSSMLPAFFEELTDRGLLLAALEDVKSDVAKVLVMGLFFGACHQNMAQFGPTMVAGMIISYVAIKSGSIVPGMIIHFINNFFVLMGSYADQVDNGLTQVINFVNNFIYSNTIIVILIALVAAWGIVYLLKILKVTCNKPNPIILPAYTTGRELTTEEKIYAIYGYPTRPSGAPTTPIYTAPIMQSTAPQNKARFKDYIFLIVAIASALAVTVFTFIWGLLR
ncbi:MAG: CPBP family intramembrane metalloprotease [Clostridia bacterium]|nr:CPBP family intramembrane metalloprotease [Clostridia bacterium]